MPTAEKESWGVRKTIDIPTIISVLGIGAAGIWALASLRSDIEIISATTISQSALISSVRLDFEKADMDIDGELKTYFTRVDVRFERVSDEIDDINDDTTALAVSLGKLEAGQVYIQQSLEQLLEQGK